jgi:RHS repeat-associated protein
MPLGDEPEGVKVDWWDDLSADQPPEPVAPPFRAAVSAPLEEDAAGEVPEVELPEPGVTEVSLGEEGDARRVGETPIDIAAGSKAVEGADLQVEVLDREVTEPAGVSGFALRVRGGDGGSLDEAARATDAGSLPVEVRVDTSGWGDLYGADYPSRIEVVALPDCALEDPAPVGCDRNGVPVESHLDAETGEIVIDVDDLSALDSATLESDETDVGPPVQVDDVSGNRPVAHESAPAEGVDDAVDREPATPAEPTDEEGSTTTSSSSTTTTSTTSTTVGTTTTTAEAEADAGATTPSTQGLQGRVDDRATNVAQFEGASAHAEGATTTVLQSGGGSAVLALTSATSSEGGNWGATPLDLTGDWLVGLGSGEFSWSYDIPVPAAPAGGTPSVGLSYSSGSIDGMVTGRNVQAGQAGLGWSDFANAFIERRYAPCDEGEVFHDLCWRSHNATISLNGHQSELVPVTGLGDSWENWVLKDDPHWKVQRRSDFVANGDNNGENWRVTTPDGTQYWFGYGLDPENGATDSAWTVPVFANGTDEPCRADDDTLAWCNQAWRWNLDRVVDRDGNVTVYRYFKESNEYGLLNGWGDATYNSGGRLAWIEYGMHDGPDGPGDPDSPTEPYDQDNFTPQGKVEFKGGYRCNHLDDPTPCPVPTKDNGNYYKDVPNEFICDSTCLVVSPTFFSTKRYSEVWTYMRVGGDYQAVDAVRLNHSMANEDEGNKNLWLRSIQRIGKQGLGSSGLALPPVTFHGTQLQNRVDYNLSQGKTPMEQYRVDGVFEEYGRNIEVTYGRPNGCTPGTNPHPDGVWDNNELSCFPQSWRAPDATANEIAVFHKWLVTQVEENDEVGGGDPIVTTYAYGSTPAWHHNDDEFLNNHKKTWSDWRGYHTVRVTNGDSATRYRIYRGMHHDRNAPLGFGSFKTVNMPSLDGTITKPDNDWMKGRILDQEQIDLADNRLTSTLTEYISDVTSDWGQEEQDDAHWVDVWKVTNSTKRRSGGFAQTRTETTYNTTDNPVGSGYVANYMPRSVLEEGWLDVATDQRCTRTSYVNYPAAGMYGYPSSQALVAGSNCDATTVLREQRWRYDEGLLGVAPTKGHVSHTQARKDASNWLPETHTLYEPLGRPKSVTDAKSHTTLTAYTPAVGNVQSTLVTNALSHTSTTNYLVERGLPKSQVDANLKTTSLDYDGLGRLISVQRPLPTTGASMEFSYDIDEDRAAPAVIRSRQLVVASPATYQDAWVVYDGLLRQRQSHTMSPDDTKTIVQSTWYDGQGRVRSSALPEAVPGTAGSGILAPAGGKQWANQTKPTYDELGRVTKETFYGVNSGSTAIVEHWNSSTAYDFNATWSTPPVGGPTQSVSDAYGQATSVSEGMPTITPWTLLSPHTTGYTYSLAGDLLTVKDPALNTITYTYDKLGRRTDQVDPDSGVGHYEYDDVGNQLSARDAALHTITTDYDALNRPTLRHEGATNLASWEYDATGEKGLFNKSTRVIPGGNWVTDVTGYDARNRPTGTKLTVPGTATGLGGDYTTSYTYNLADQPTSVTYPAAGGLAQETVTTTYHNTLGLPATMTGANPYANVAFYDDRGRPSLFGFGMHTGFADHTMARTWTYNADQRLASVSNAASGGFQATKHDMAYDAVGNVTQRTTNLGSNNFRECFTYDVYQRLTRVVTTGVTDPNSCAGGGPATPAGSLPYEQDFTHGIDGNLLTRDDGTGTVSYTYPAGGTSSVRPHAPTQVGTSTNTYTWDANGDLDTRTVGGVATDFTFDREHNLASTTNPTGTSTFVYDASGQRLYTKTPQGSTLYLDGQEVNATPGGSPTVTATRTYTFGGMLVATRSTTGGVDYLVTDHQGSVEAKIDAGGSVVSTLRAYKPYGQSRTTDTFATQRGWIGQVQDTGNNLSYLNARYYDPNIARFISPDPIYNQAQPKSINPYTYAWGNPITGSDPSGLFADCECGFPIGTPDLTPPRPTPPCGCGGADTRGGGGGGGGGGRTTIRSVSGPSREQAQETLDAIDILAAPTLVNPETLGCVSGCLQLMMGVSNYQHAGCPGLHSILGQDCPFVLAYTGYVRGLIERSSQKPPIFDKVMEILNAIDAAAGLSAGPGSGGKLRVEGDGFSASEQSVAQRLYEDGHDVVLREATGGERTSDLILDGENWDIYTPETGNVSRMVDSVASKGSQVRGGGVVIDLSRSPLSSSDIPSNFLTRVQNITSRVSNVIFYD